MSKLAELIQEKRITKSKLIASTIRISVEDHSFVEELAEQLEISKQGVLATLVEHGISEAKKALKLDKIEEGVSECSFHLLNTNKRHNVEDTQRMIKEEIAAAFYSPWKLNINRIRKGDVVFLYENGVGIVAFGHASGETIIRDYNGDPEEFYYQKLSNFTVLDKPIKAKEAKKILNANIVFLRTMVSVSDGQKLFDAAKNRNET